MCGKSRTFALGNNSTKHIKKNKLTMSKTSLLNAVMGHELTLKLEWQNTEGADISDLPTEFELPLGDDIKDEIANLEETCGRKLAHWDVSDEFVTDPDTEEVKSYVVISQLKDYVPVVHGAFTTKHEATKYMLFNLCHYLDRIKGEYEAGDIKAVEMIAQAAYESRDSYLHSKTGQMSFKFNRDAAIVSTTTKRFAIKESRMFIRKQK